MQGHILEQQYIPKASGQGISSENLKRTRHTSLSRYLFLPYFTRLGGTDSCVSPGLKHEACIIHVCKEAQPRPQSWGNKRGNCQLIPKPCNSLIWEELEDSMLFFFCVCDARPCAFEASTVPTEIYLQPQIHMLFYKAENSHYSLKRKSSGDQDYPQFLASDQSLHFSHLVIQEIPVNPS